MLTFRRQHGNHRRSKTDAPAAIAAGWKVSRLVSTSCLALLQFFSIAPLKCAGRTTIGGSKNVASGSYSIVVGGTGNHALNAFSTVAGGSGSTASGFASSVLGAANSTVDGDYSAVSGGSWNSVDAAATYVAVGGGYANMVLDGATATIGGGNVNAVLDGDAATIVGGAWNTASGVASSIAGGGHNSVLGLASMIAGGGFNLAFGDYATVVGGHNNVAAAANTTIVGGVWNQAHGEDSVVAGGRMNVVDSAYSVVSGGSSNSVSGDFAQVGGGVANTVHGVAGSVGGGSSNSVTGENGVVGGGTWNWATANAAVVVGGSWNTAFEVHGVVGGGAWNTAVGVQATIVGGLSNTAEGNLGVVAGGTCNSAVAMSATVGGGSDNGVVGPFGFIGGGVWNTVAGYGATVLGGEESIAFGDLSVLAGGQWNSAVGSLATVSGGSYNTAKSAHATVGGGASNVIHESVGAVVAGGMNNIMASAKLGVIVGGSWNSASGMASSVVGGEGNIAGTFSSVVGGVENIARGNASTIAGGWMNTASGAFSAIVGGRFNEVSGEDGFAVGAAASVVHHGAAVLSFGASAVGPTAADPVSEGATCASVQNHSINVCVEGMGGFFVNGAPVLTQLFGNVTQCQSQVAAQAQEIRELTTKVSDKDRSINSLNATVQQLQMQLLDLNASILTRLSMIEASLEATSFVPTTDSVTDVTTAECVSCGWSTTESLEVNGSGTAFTATSKELQLTDATTVPDKATSGGAVSIRKTEYSTLDAASELTTISFSDRPTETSTQGTTTMDITGMAATSNEVGSGTSAIQDLDTESHQGPRNFTSVADGMTTGRQQQTTETVSAAVSRPTTSDGMPRVTSMAVTESPATGSAVTIPRSTWSKHVPGTISAVGTVLPSDSPSTVGAILASERVSMTKITLATQLTQITGSTGLAQAATTAFMAPSSASNYLSTNAIHAASVRSETTRAALTVVQNTTSFSFDVSSFDGINNTNVSIAAIVDMLCALVSVQGSNCSSELGRCGASVIQVGDAIGTISTSTTYFFENVVEFRDDKSGQAACSSSTFNPAVNMSAVLESVKPGLYDRSCRDGSAVFSVAAFTASNVSGFCTVETELNVPGGARAGGIDLASEIQNAALTSSVLANFTLVSNHTTITGATQIVFVDLATPVSVTFSTEGGGLEDLEAALSAIEAAAQDKDTTSDAWVQTSTTFASVTTMSNSFGSGQQLQLHVPVLAGLCALVVVVVIVVVIVVLLRKRRKRVVRAECEVDLHQQDRALFKFSGNNHGRSTREPQGSAISMNDAVAEVLVLQQPSRRLSQRDADKSTNGALRLQSRHPRQVPHQLNSLARLNGRASQPITQGENSKGVHAAALEEGKTQDLDVQGDSGAIGVNVRRAHTVEQPVRQSIVKEADFDDGTVEPIVVPRINIHRVKRNLNVRGKTLAQVVPAPQEVKRVHKSKRRRNHSKLGNTPTPANVQGEALVSEATVTDI